MFQDILRESWVYQEIGQEYLEKGVVKGQREMLLSFVQTRFPEAMALAKQQLERITDSEVLQKLFLQLSATDTVEEAKKILLEVDNNKNKH